MGEGETNGVHHHEFPLILERNLVTGGTYLFRVMVDLHASAVIIDVGHSAKAELI